MNPVLGAAKVDKLLSQFSQMYRPTTPISERILPVLKVKEKTGKYAKYGKENFRVYSNQIYRAPGTRAHSIDYSVSQGDYVCKERSLEKLVPDEIMNNQDDPYDAKRDATAVILDIIATNQDIVLYTWMSNTANMPLNVTLTGTDKWTDPTGSDPVGDIETARAAVRAATGMDPNVFVLSENVRVALKAHPAVREMVKYTNGGQYSDGALVSWLKDYFGFTEVIIGKGIYNAAAEGQTDDLRDLWANNAWVLYRTPTPTLMQATFGLTLQDLPTVVDVYREEPKVSDVVRARKSYDQNIFDNNLGYLIKNAV